MASSVLMTHRRADRIEHLVSSVLIKHRPLVSGEADTQLEEMAASNIGKYGFGMSAGLLIRPPCTDRV